MMDAQGVADGISTGMKVIGYGGVASFGIWVASKLVSQFSMTRSDVADDGARAALVNGLSARVDALEKAQAQAMAQFDAERQRRLDAEATVAKLSLRVAVLEAQLRNLGHDPQ